MKVVFNVHTLDLQLMESVIFDLLEIGKTNQVRMGAYDAI